MQIRIDVSVCEDPTAHRWLDRLLNKIEDGWHVWEVTGEEGYLTTCWATTRGEQARWLEEVFRAAVERSAWQERHGRQINVCASPAGADQLSPEQAARLAEEKLVVLVENRHGDGDFLLRVIAELAPKWFTKWWNQHGGHRGDGPARIDSLGGKGSMQQEVNQVSRTPRPRYVVVVDSDRLIPNGPASREAQRLAERCRELRVPCWVLAKREAENYLPLEFLRQRPNSGRTHSQAVDAWDTMSDEQKDVFDMKQGFPQERAREAGVFDNLADDVRDRLATGFGAEIGECWSVQLPRDEAQQALLDRGGDDLQRGLELLMSEV